MFDDEDEDNEEYLREFNIRFKVKVNNNVINPTAQVIMSRETITENVLTIKNIDNNSVITND